MEIDDVTWQSWEWQLENPLTAKTLGVEDCRYFPMRVTPYYASLINWEDADDPLRKQILPNANELQNRQNYSDDPFDECGCSACAPGVKQRFADRILVMVRTDCSTYCRHCTRKHLLKTAKKADLETVLKILRERPAVREVLLSGGDPMIAPDDEILMWLDALSELPQIEAIRIGTRTPVVLPMRFTDSLVAKLSKYEKIWVNTQFNHPRELTPESIEACRKLVGAGIPVSNQSVMLHGVNDEPEIMRELCAKLQKNRIRPYYIFLCDPVAGIEHFRTSIDAAKKMQEYLLTHLGGLAVPRVVADIPNAKYKKNIETLNADTDCVHL